MADRALRCDLIVEPCPKVALGVAKLRPFVEAALKESKEDRVHIMEMAKARVRFAIPPKRKNVVPNHFRQDSADAEPWGSITGQDKRANFPTSKAHISAVFHSFRLIFGRAIISRSGLEA
ncbi:alpha-N-acetylglucosaminidase [Aureococcus anophagefferens]|nr:alpha-N-acetylglucosaminidase [Aureococcus anophagefferens]